MSISHAFSVQSRVIYALILREVHTLYGDSRLGYLWAIVQNLVGIVFFWALREFMGFRPPHGMSIVTYLLSGFIVWYLFTQTLNKCLSAVKGNNALLTYPQVTPLDLMVSRTIVVWVTQIVSAFVLCIIALYFDYVINIVNFGGFLVVILLTPLLGLGCGAICATLSYYWPTVEKIIPIIMRIMFFASGVFFSVSSFPMYIQKYLLWNPVMHLIEWMRMSLSYSFANSGVDILYPSIFTLIVLALGLLFERYVRGRFTV